MSSAGLDWPALMRVGLRPREMGGLGLHPAQFWALTPAELALMLGIEPGAGLMTRDRLAELVTRYPDGPQNVKTGGPDDGEGRI